MDIPRREALRKGAILSGLGVSAWYLSCWETVCFGYSHFGYDDAPDKLTIRHKGGKNLPAREVLVENILVEYDNGRNRRVGTAPWHELDDELTPTDGIGGAVIDVDIRFPEAVRIYWRRERTNQLIGSKTFPRD